MHVTLLGVCKQGHLIALLLGSTTQNLGREVWETVMMLAFDNYHLASGFYCEAGSERCLWQHMTSYQPLTTVIQLLAKYYWTSAIWKHSVCNREWDRELLYCVFLDNLLQLLSLSGLGVNINDTYSVLQHQCSHCLNPSRTQTLHTMYSTLNPDNYIIVSVVMVLEEVKFRTRSLCR